MFSDPIAAARALLPWWVPWGNLLFVSAAAAATAAASTWLTAAIATRPLRRAEREGSLAPDERVRLLHPFVRSVGRIRLVMIVLIPAASLLFGDDLAYVPRAGVAVVAAIVTIFVSGRVARPFRRDAPMARATRVQRLKVIGFIAIWLCRLPLVLAILYFVGEEPDARTWIVLLLGVVAFVILWFGGMTWLLRVTRVAGPASERLLAAVRTAAERCEMAAPRVFEIDLPVTNAFALPSGRSIVAMRGLLDHLDDAELASICTHEAAHLTEGRWMAVGRHVGDVALLILGASRLLLLRLDLVPALVVVLAITVTVIVIARLVASHGERRADAIAHRAEPAPDVYLRALEKIHRENAIPLALSKHRGAHRGLLRRIFGSGGIHGSFVERAAALGAAPPADAKPPSRARALAARLAGAVVLASGVAAMVLASSISWWVPPGSTSDPGIVQIAFGDAAADGLAQLAAEWNRAGRVDDAATLLAARAEIEPQSLDALFDLATLYADAGRIEQGRAVLAEADLRLRAPPLHARRFGVEFWEADTDERRARLEERSRKLAQRLGVKNR